MRFHHVGIACREIAPAVAQFQALHPDSIALTEIVHDPEQKADLKLLQTADGTRFEFISGPAVQGLLTRQIDLYHTCFETDDLDQTVARFLAQKAVPLGPAKKAILFDNRRVIFLKTLHGIVELLEA